MKWKGCRVVIFPEKQKTFWVQLTHPAWRKETDTHLNWTCCWSCWNQTLWPKQPGRKSLFGSHFHFTVRSSSVDVRTETQAGQGLGRSWCRGHGRLLLILTCSPFFLREPRTTSPRVSLPTMGWALDHQPLIKKMPCRLAWSPVLWRHCIFLIEAASSQVTLTCVKST